jgi:hypothetical protein
LRKDTDHQPVSAFDVIVHEDWKGINFEAASEAGTTTVASHRFASAGDAEAFLARYQAADNATLWALFDAACLREGAELTRRIDAVLEHGTMFDQPGSGGSRRDSPTVH